MKLTAASVAKLTLPEGKSEAFYWDDDVPGFGLRLRAGGSRVWVLQHRIGAASGGSQSAPRAPSVRRTLANLPPIYTPE